MALVFITLTPLLGIATTLGSFGGHLGGAVVTGASAVVGIVLLVLSGGRTGGYAVAGTVFAASVWAMGILGFVMLATTVDTTYHMVFFSTLIIVLFTLLASGAVFLTAPGPSDGRVSRALLAALVVGPLLWLVGYLVDEPSIDYFLPFLAGTLVSLGLWSLLGDRMAGWVVRRFVDPGRHRLFRFRDPFDGRTATSMEARNILRLTAVPLFFAYALATWLDVFSESATTEAEVMFGSFWVLAFGSVLVVPWKWHFDILGLRAYDQTTGVAEEIKGPSLIDEFIGIGAFFGLVQDSFGGGGAVSFHGLWMGVLRMWMTLWGLLPVTLIPVVLYARFRLPKDLLRIRDAVDYVEVDHLNELHTARDPTGRPSTGPPTRHSEGPRRADDLDRPRTA